MESSAAQHHHVSITGLNILGYRRADATGTPIGCKRGGMHIASVHLQTPTHITEPTQRGCQTAHLLQLDALPRRAACCMLVADVQPLW
jgi:hypothetical protein